jgi:hypothetical protein
MQVLQLLCYDFASRRGWPMNCSDYIKFIFLFTAVSYFLKDSCFISFRYMVGHSFQEPSAILYLSVYVLGVGIAQSV